MNKTYEVAYGDEVKIVTHPKGTCTWSWNEGAPDAAANERCRTAIKQTIDYFNEWTGIMGFHLSGHYGSGTPTADCSYGGWMRIGPNAGNQAIGTVLHETGHGVGVGPLALVRLTDTRRTSTTARGSDVRPTRCASSWRTTTTRSSCLRATVTAGARLGQTRCQRHIVRLARQRCRQGQAPGAAVHRRHVHPPRTVHRRSLSPRRDYR